MDASKNLKSHRNILLPDGLDPVGIQSMREVARVVNRAGITAGELSEIIADYEAIIVRSRTHLNRELILKAKCLRVIGRAGVGVDNIDLNAARMRNIIVVNTPSATSRAVAELTVGLLFSLAREIPRADAGMKSGMWLKSELQGFELAGKTLGLIGMGNIGREVCRMANALGMNVIGYDPLIPADEIKYFGALPGSLDHLITTADMISLHIPLTSETQGFLNAHAFARMKPGVYILCTARGGLIDETALLAALETGHVGGAAMDVFVQEPPGLTKLVQHPRLIATPHLGAQTKEAQKRSAEDIASEVLRALDGKSLRWRVA